MPEAIRGWPWEGLRRFVSDPSEAGAARRRTRLSVELLMIVWLCWVYDAINNLAPLRKSLAVAHAGSILHVERVVHLDPEGTLDHWLLHHRTLALWVSDYYDNVHFAVTLILVVILWLRFPRLYRPLRNTMVLANLIAMAVFWVFPTAPPRLLDPTRFPDVVSVVGGIGSWHSGALATAANEFAAMPSLHIAWACWSALALDRLFAGRRWAPVVWLYPGVTVFAVMSTGNHFLFDALAGAATLGVSAVVANQVEVWQAARAATAAAAVPVPVPVPAARVCAGVDHLPVANRPVVRVAADGLAVDDLVIDGGTVTDLATGGPRQHLSGQPALRWTVQP